MAQEKRQNYLQGAAILTVGILIIKILGFIYKIPLYNILGTEGTTDFNVAYSIYNVMLTLSTAGLPVALSRMISESLTLERHNQVKRNFNVALMVFLILGTIGTFAMFFFPDALAGAMNERDAALAIRAMSPAVLLVCLMSAYRGYAQGHSNMMPTSVSQVIEVAGKVVVGLALAWFFSSAGKSVSTVAAGAILGTSFGSVLALIWLIFAKRKIDSKKTVTATDKADSIGKTFNRLLVIGIPIAIGSCVLSLMTLIDTSLVLSRLQNALGLDLSVAKALFGEYTYATAIYNLPTALLVPFTLSVVPAIAAYIAEGKQTSARDVAESSLRMSTIVSLPMGIGMSVLSFPVMNVLYWGKVTEIGPNMLAILGIASYFVGITTVMTAVLQAHGKERLPVISMIVGAVVKISINWVLVGNPDISISGAAVGTLACFVVMCALNFIFIQHTLEKKLRLSKIIVRPLISAAVMGACAWAVYGLLEKLLLSGDDAGRMMMTLCMVIAIGVAAVVYLILVFAIKAITLDDIKLLPKGDKIANKLKMK